MDSRTPELKRRGSAFHEAAHAVAALDRDFAFTPILLDPEGTGRGRPGGHLRLIIPRPEPGRPITAEQWRRAAVAALAGAEGERMETGGARVGT